MSNEITASQTIGAILKAYPSALSVLQEYGLGCAGCPLNTLETLEEGAKAHGLSEEEILTLSNRLSNENRIR